ncbi:MAG: metal-binding protein [Betaproteobacteria bacterium]|nr:metal-binding protein [Betaproteobacteria bacterium]
MDPQGLQTGQAVLSRTLLALLLAAATCSAAAGDEALPPVVVYAPSPCLACIDWADHLRQNGFTVSIEETLLANMPKLKRWLNVPAELESVHTAKVGRYFVEGHVPAEDIKLLLKEKPRARGLAVPGLPRGAPGREVSNPFCETACTILDNAGQDREIRREAYNTLLVGPDGKTSVFARH